MAHGKLMDQFIQAIDHSADSTRDERQSSRARSQLALILLASAGMLQPIALLGDAVPVRHTEGLMHGFLVLRVR